MLFLFTVRLCFFFFFNDTATTEIYTLSLHDALPITVNQSPSTTTLTSSTNPAVFGQSVAFTATVTGTNGTATGTVTFKDGATSLSTNTLVSGQAAFTTSALSVTNYSIIAVYNGDGVYNVSTSSVLTQTVNKADTTTTLVSSNNPSVFGQSVIFAATVSANAPGAGAPTGTVIFKDGTTSLTTNTLVAGVARYTNTTFSVADHLITAVYNGDTSFNTNTSSTVTQTVNKADATTTLVSSNNPSVFGQPVIFAASVSANAFGAGSPMGTVIFK